MLAAAILLFTNPTHSEEPRHDPDTDTAQTDFFTALENGDRKAANAALDRGAIWTRADKFGRKPYMFAAESGNLEFYMWAEQHDPPADINETDIARRTALHFAAGSTNQNGHPADLVRYLRSKGADVNAKNISGQTPLFETTIPANIDAAMALFEAPMKTEDFLNAHRDQNRDNAQSDYQTLIEKAVEGYKSLPDDKKVDVRATTNNNETPLHILFKNGESEFAAFLLLQGVPIDIVTNNKISTIDEITQAETLHPGETARQMAERKLVEDREKLVMAKNEDNTSLIAALERQIDKLNAILEACDRFVAGEFAKEDAIVEDEDSAEKQGGATDAVDYLSPERGELLDHIAEMYVRWREEFKTQFASHEMGRDKELLDLASEKDIFRIFFTLPGTAPTITIPLRFHEPFGGLIPDKIYVPSPYWYCDKVRYLNITQEEYLQLGKILRKKDIENVSRDDLAVLDLINECSERGPESSVNQFDIDITLLGPKVQAAKAASSGTIIYTLSNAISTTPVMGISLATYPSSDYLELFELLATFGKGNELLKSLFGQINSGKVTIRQPMLVPDEAKERIPHIFWGSVAASAEGVKVLYIDRFTPLGILLPEFLQALIETNDTEFDSVLVEISADYSSMSDDDSGKRVINYILKSEVPALMRILNNPVASLEMKLAAIHFLGSLGHDAKIASGTLERQANTANPSTLIKHAARAALARIRAK